MVQLRAFGTLELTRSGDVGATIVLTQPKRLMLLAYLAVATPRGYHRRDTLLALFWPELDEEHARGALSQGLLHLRWGVGPDVILSRGTNDIGLDSSRIWCDVLEFETCLANGALVRAMELYRGDFLRGVHLSGLVELERWVEGERVQRRTQCSDTAWLLAERAEKAGDARAAARWAARAAELAPDDEVAVRRQIELLARLGDRAGAVAAYERLARRLETEFEVEPSAATRAVITALRSRHTHDAEPLGISSAPVHTATPGTPVAARPDPDGAGAEVRHDRSRLAKLWRAWPFAAAAIFIAAMALSVVITTSGQSPEIAGVGHDSKPTRIAVFPFAVHGDSGLEYLGEGMVDLLGGALDGAGDVRRVDPYALLSVVDGEHGGAADPARLRAIAEQFHADLYVLGSVVSVDTQLVVSATLYESGDARDPIGIVQRRGGIATLASLVDGIASDLLRDRLLADPNAGVRQAAAISRTTTSLAALKSYLSGQRWVRAGQYNEAARSFESAIVADSMFAPAYVALHHALGFGANSAFGWTQEEIVARAMRLGARLGHRDRVMLSALDASWARREPAEAIALLSGLVQEYPDDVEAWMLLGSLEFQHGMRSGRPIDEIRSVLQRASDLDSTNMERLIELRWLANAEWNEADDVRISERMLKLAPQSDFRSLMLVDIALMRGQREAAIRTVEDVRRLDGLHRWLYVVQVAMHTDDMQVIRNAASLITDPVNPSRLRARGYTILAHVNAAHGHWRAAANDVRLLQSIDSGLALRTLGVLALTPASRQSPTGLRSLRDQLRSSSASTPQDSIRIFYLAGMLSAKIAEYEDALTFASSLDSVSRQLSTKPSSASLGAEAGDRALSIRAQTAWKRGDLAAALHYLETARPEKWWPPDANEDLFANWAPERFMRAEILWQLGRQDEAANWYAGLRLTECELVFDAVVNLRLGAYAERRGDYITASSRYGRVLAHWTDGDADAPDYASQARAALARLDRSAVLR
jgi:serine/threonine-protein kinase